MTQISNNDAVDTIAGADEISLRDRIKGCLMAGAIGDALGYEIEFISWNSIRKEFGEKGITDLVLDGDKARFSDDTQMTLFTNEGMIFGLWRSAERGISAEIEYYIYQAYLCWLRTQGYEKRKKEPLEPLWAPVSELLQEPGMNKLRAPGNTCLSALCSERMGTIEKPINNSKGCGGVMRTAPLGFMGCWGKPVVTGAKAAAITHGHPGGWLPAGMLSDMVYRMIYGPDKPLTDVVDDSLNKVLELWDDYPETNAFVAMIRNAVRLADTDIPDVDAIHSIGGGWVGDEALAIAIFSCLRHPDNIREALISAVNHSGDSDSTGAIAGNILGTYLGYQAIPEEWIARIEMKDLILKQAEKAVTAVEYVNRNFIDRPEENL